MEDKLSNLSSSWIISSYHFVLYHSIFYCTFFVSDVLEFLQALNAHDLPSSLRERYNKLLDDVSGVFEEDELDSEGSNTQFIEEDDVTHHQHRQQDYKEDNIHVDNNFISFPTDSRSNDSTTGHQYPYMGKAPSEDDKLYDETDLNQDYEPVTFGE